MKIQDYNHRLGVKAGKLTPCPQSPNCVSSQANDKKHYIEPLQFSVKSSQDWEKLTTIIQSLAGTTIIEQRENYLRVECKTRLMGFIDDLEFAWNAADNICHVRSASRVGYSDLGKNRRRVEQIRRLFINSSQ